MLRAKAPLVTSIPFHAPKPAMRTLASYKTRCTWYYGKLVTTTYGHTCINQTTTIYTSESPCPIQKGPTGQTTHKETSRKCASRPSGAPWATKGVSMSNDGRKGEGRQHLKAPMRYQPSARLSIPPRLSIRHTCGFFGTTRQRLPPGPRSLMTPQTRAPEAFLQAPGPLALPSHSRPHTRPNE